MGTTHIRISKELKEELKDCEGENFTERIKSYSQAHNKDVNGNVNKNSELEEIKSELKDVNKKLTRLEPLTKKEVDDVFSRYR